VNSFSPGFMAPAGRAGSPRTFVSHGTRDEVLPIDLCSCRIVPELERGSYEVTYREFDGGMRSHPRSPWRRLAYARGLPIEDR
jgi:predicted esterase